MGVRLADLHDADLMFEVAHERRGVGAAGLDRPDGRSAALT
jgi:hypothetical protein